MSYDTLFQLFLEGKREALIKELDPWLPRWAKDVLKFTPQERNRSYREELISAGFEQLIVEVDKRLRSPRSILSGKHLVNSLRKAIRKSMRKARRQLWIVPRPLPDTIRERIRRGEERYLPWELLKKVPMLGTFRHARSNSERREKATHEAFFASDETLIKEYWQFLEMLSSAARHLGEVYGWSYLELIIMKGVSVAEVARLTNTPRETVRDRLHRLRRAIVSSASPDLRDLGEQFLGRYWSAAA